MLAVVKRIVVGVDLPVTVDFEGGYAVDPATVAANVRKLVALGVAGLNFEDQIVGGTGLYDIGDQAARLRAVRRAADAAGIPIFVNARTDVFLKAAGQDHAGLLDEAVARAAAYAAAGADGFFVPGLTDHRLIRDICDRCALPVNAMVTTDPQTVRDIAALGVSCISLGPHPYIDAVSGIERHAAGYL